MALKQLFRCSTNVFIPDNIENGVLEAIEMPGKEKILLMEDGNIVEALFFIKIKTTLKKSMILEKIVLPKFMFHSFLLKNSWEIITVNMVFQID